MEKIPLNIFKAYDIRGLADGELTPEIAYRIGRAFVAFLKKRGILGDEKKVVVGYDMRKTSPMYQEQVIKGINDEGVGVVDIGLTTTPLFNFSCAHVDRHAGGIMITASHNPAQYNGFKLTLENGLPIGEFNGMSEIRDMVVANDFGATKSVRGDVVSRGMFPEYMHKIFEICDVGDIKPFKVIIDAGNGMAAVTFPKMFADLPLDVDYLYLEPDGTFPNHEANPLKVETLSDLQKKIKQEGADFGFALDGDVDRIGLVDEKGEVVDASFVGAMIGELVLEKFKSGNMLYDLRSSRIIKEVWESKGATTTMCPIGHALIKKMMKDTGSIFASELSLHLYYKDVYDVESPELSFLYILKALSKSNCSLSQLVEKYKKYYHSGEINFEVDDVVAKFEKISAKFKDKAIREENIDGLWYEFEWGWFSVRKSNTEPVLRLNLEAWTLDDKEKYVKEISALIQE
jgi:phosphomannomutase